MADKIFSRNILEFAFRKVAAEHSESPIYFVLPARRISSRAPMDSSNGVSEMHISIDATMN